MPYFHGTEIDKLPSILEHGLGGVDTGPVSEQCERGTYLASDPRLAIMILVMHYEKAAQKRPPREALAAMRIIVVDDSRIHPSRLRPDPQVRKWRGSWLYDGVIDVRNAAVVSAADVLQAWDDSIPTDWVSLEGTAA